jgi:hypothetical protein
MSDLSSIIKSMFDLDESGSIFAAVSPPADVAASPG